MLPKVKYLQKFRRYNQGNSYLCRQSEIPMIRKDNRKSKKLLLAGCLCMLVFLAVTSCKETTASRSLSEREFHYDDPLSALSLDGNGYWIGGENGIVWHAAMPDCNYGKRPETRSFTGSPSTFPARETATLPTTSTLQTAVCSLRPPRGSTQCLSTGSNRDSGNFILSVKTVRNRRESLSW